VGNRERLDLVTKSKIPSLAGYRTATLKPVVRNITDRAIANYCTYVLKSSEFHTAAVGF
jgi:hypothetical protein